MISEFESPVCAQKTQLGSIVFPVEFLSSTSHCRVDVKFLALFLFLFFVFWPGGWVLMWERGERGKDDNLHRE